MVTPLYDDPVTRVQLSHFNFGCLQFLKQKLKEQLQRTRQTERNKESRTLGLEAIAE